MPGHFGVGDGKVSTNLEERGPDNSGRKHRRLPALTPGPTDHPYIDEEEDEMATVIEKATGGSEAEITTPFLLRTPTLKRTPGRPGANDAGRRQRQQPVELWNHQRGRMVKYKR